MPEAPENNAPQPEEPGERDRTPIQSLLMAPGEAIHKIMEFVGEKGETVANAVDKTNTKVANAIEVDDESSADRPRYRERPAVAAKELAKTTLGVPARAVERLTTPVGKTGSSLIKTAFHGVMTGVSAFNTALDIVAHPIQNFTKFRERSKVIGENLKTTFKHGWEGVKNLFVTGGRALNTVKDGVILNATRLVSDGTNSLKRNFQSTVNHIPLIGPKVLHHIARPFGWIARKPHQFLSWAFGLPKRIAEKMAENASNNEQPSN